MIQDRSENSSQNSSKSTLASLEEAKKTAMSTPSEPAIPSSIPKDPSSSSECESSEELIVTRKVSFKRTLKLRKISSHREYTEKECKAAWYSPAEYKKMRDNASKTAKKIARGKNVDKDGKDSSRGLEFQGTKDHKIRQTKRLDIIFTVLCEEDEMFENGEDLDHDKIAQIYAMCSKECKKEARQRGRKDEAAVKIPKAPTRPSINHPVFSSDKKADDIMSLVASLSMMATMTIVKENLPDPTNINGGVQSVGVEASPILSPQLRTQPKTLSEKRAAKHQSREKLTNAFQRVIQTDAADSVTPRRIV